MASPFPAVVPASGDRKIRPGCELIDFRQEHQDGKILPKNGEKNVLITSALPYVNNQPHLVTYESPLELLKPRCSACGSTPTERLTAHLHIKLKELQPQIESWVKETSEKGTWSSNGKAFTNGWLKGGLQSRGMTRDLKWGVKLPEELGEKWAEKVMYVWFDAPIGYPSITANYTDEWKQWWQNPENVTLYQFMGKDNVPFHTVLFPAYLMGTNEPWTMLNSISTTEYLQYEGTKFSKSKNVGVFGQNARSTGVAASVWRYYLLQNRPETSDSEFTWDDFVARNNSELLNNLGNFVNRMLKFVNAKYESILPDPSSSSTSSSSSTVDYSLPESARAFAEEDAAFVSDIDGFLASFVNDMDHQKIRSALATIMQISARGNQFIQDNRVDNALLVSNPARAAQVVLATINLIYVLSALVHPFMPSTSDEILKQLNATPRSIPDKFEIVLLPGHHIGTASHLFGKIDLSNIEKWRGQFGGDSVSKPTTSVEEAPKLSRKQADKAKKEAKAQAEALKASVPRTPEQARLEEEIKGQGEVVRRLKLGEGKEGEVTEVELGKLQALKAELKEITEKLKAASL
ncbi:methionyl-tRNA synthetase, partial [Phenoliferia sp. Uapishka_3]